MMSTDDVIVDAKSTIIGRNWVNARSRNSSRHNFRIATYNVLTDSCIRPGQYDYCPEDIRYMTSRHVSIMAEVKDMAADIICFQEVDYAHYVNRLKPSMKLLGFEGVLHQRLDDQGLATFWNIDNFKLIDQKHSVLHHVAETHLQMTSLSSAQLSVVRQSISRPEAVLCIRLRHINTDTQLAVGNLHVTWSQLKFPALQALQVAMAASELNEFANGRYGDAMTSQILLGDFNSPPDSLSYSMMSRGHIDDVISREPRPLVCDNSELELNALRENGLLTVLPSTTFNVRTPFKSAYKTLLGAEPAVTNCDDACQDGRCILCLDYIWFSHHSLEVTAVLETPSCESITRHYSLPSVDFPSDHVPLMAELSFKY